MATQCWCSFCSITQKLCIFNACKLLSKKVSRKFSTKLYVEMLKLNKLKLAIAGWKLRLPGKKNKNCRQMWWDLYFVNWNKHFICLLSHQKYLKMRQPGMLIQKSLKIALVSFLDAPGRDKKGPWRKSERKNNNYIITIIVLCNMNVSYST